MTPKGLRQEADALTVQAGRLIQRAQDLRQEADAQEAEAAFEEERGRDRGFGICPDCGYGYFRADSRPCSELGGPF